MAYQFDLDPEILSSYLAGEITPHGKAAMDKWLDSNPKRKAWLVNVQTAWESVPPEQIPVFDLEAFKSKIDVSRTQWAQTEALHRISSNSQEPGDMAQKSGQVIHPVQPTQSSNLWASLVRIGTISRLVVVAVLLIASWIAGSNQKISSLSELTSTYTTASGERATITLPDGSTVVLNVGSRLEVPSDFSAGKRIVHLNGEALFTVVHQHSAPFTVIAGKSTTKVLGTAFVVRHYDTDTATLVAVKDGKVMVEDSVLTANQQISSYSHGLSAVKPVGYAPFTFAQGIMTLENTTLVNAVPGLARWYNVEIRIGDAAIDSRNITGEFAVGSISELTEILDWTFDIKVVKNGRILTLFPK